MPRGRRSSPAKSGISRIDDFQVDDLPCQIAGQIPRGSKADGKFNPDDWMEPKESRKVDPFIVYAMAAADQALDDAGWHPETYDDQIATGVLIGSGIGGLQGIEDASLTLRDRGPRRISPFFIPGRLINLASGQVSIRHGLKGPNHSVVTACSTGAHAIGDAARLIALGDADVMVAGGAESPVCRLAMAGLRRLQGAVHAFQRPPGGGLASLRPRPRRLRHGRGRGHRRARGARARARPRRQDLRRGDRLRPVRRRLPHHRAGRGWRRRRALHAHGAEARRDRARRHRLHQRARHLDPDRRRDRTAAPSSGWSATPPAASACRRPSRRPATCSVPPARSRRSSRCLRSATTSCRRPSTSTIRRWSPPIDLVPHTARKRQIDVALSNSFGFGGTNASLVFRRDA